jgi:hypothetical protein
MIQAALRVGISFLKPRDDFASPSPIVFFFSRQPSASHSRDYRAALIMLKQKINRSRLFVKLSSLVCRNDQHMSIRG